jgi:MHS family proline/betaine transporter-like MFS transporter
LGETLRGHWRMILNLVGIVLLLNIADYILLTTMPAYFTNQLHINDTTTSLVIIGVELVQMALIAPVGALSDRIGRKPILLTAATGFILLSYPSFYLMQLGSLVGLVVGFLIVALLLLCMLAVIGSTFPAMFPTRVRYGSFAIGYNVSTALFGGTAGFVVEALIKATGNTYVPAFYLILAGLIGLVPILLIPETSRVPMEHIESRPSWRNAPRAVTAS